MTPESEFQQHFSERVTRRVTWVATKIVTLIVFATIAIFVVGEIVHLLWNALMPALFHLPVIGYWQAVGLMILSWFLFGGLRGLGRRGPRDHQHWRERIRDKWQQRMRDRFEQMSPEEREKFREWIHTRCGPDAASAAQSNP